MGVLTILNILHLIYLFYHARFLIFPALFFTGFGACVATMLISPLMGSFLLFCSTFYATMVFISYVPYYMAQYWWLFYLEGFWQTSLIIFSLI